MCNRACYHSSDVDCTSAVHGDDFATEGDDPRLDALERVLQESSKLTRKGRIGPGATQEEGRAGEGEERGVREINNQFEFYQWFRRGSR